MPGHEDDKPSDGLPQDEQDIILNDAWTLYFHDPYNTDWTCPSYKRLCDMTSVSEFASVIKYTNTRLHNGMFFLFREHVFPCWDDPENINGGCFSIKVLKKDLAEFWFDAASKMLGETLIRDNQNDFTCNDVTGMSTSSKKSFCIIKIWMSNPALTAHTLLNINRAFYGDVFYKSNRENIQTHN